MCYDLFNIIEINAGFKKQLESIITSTSTEKEQQLCNLFKQFETKFKRYSVYIRNYKQSIQVVTSEKKKNEKFASFLLAQSNALKEEEYTNFNLSGLLITVVQRLPRYVLLMEGTLLHDMLTVRFAQKYVR